MLKNYNISVKCGDIIGLKEALENAIKSNNTKELVDYLPFKIYNTHKYGMYNEKEEVHNAKIVAVSKDELVYLSFSSFYNEDSIFDTEVTEYHSFDLSDLKKMKWALDEISCKKFIKQIDEEQEKIILSFTYGLNSRLKEKFLNFVKDHYTYKDFEGLDAQKIREKIQKISNKKIKAYFSEDDFKESGKYYIQRVLVYAYQKLYCFLTKDFLANDTIVKLHHDDDNDYGFIFNFGSARLDYEEGKADMLYWLENVFQKRIYTGDELLNWSYKIVYDAKKGKK